MNINLITGKKSNSSGNRNRELNNVVGTKGRELNSISENKRRVINDTSSERAGYYEADPDYPDRNYSARKKDEYEDYNSGYFGPEDDYEDEDYYYDDGSRDPLHQRRTWLIGRNSPCDIIYDDPSVSRLHAQIVKTKNAFYISDLHSSNGTYINGYQLVGESRLYEEDVVRIGGVVFTFTEDMF